MLAAVLIWASSDSGTAKRVVGGGSDVDVVINIQSQLGSAVAAGDTSGAFGAYQSACSPSSAPVVRYRWTAPASGSYVFSTSGSSFDTALDVWNDLGESIGCNDDSNSTLQSTVIANVTGGASVMIIVGGFGAMRGAYQLSIGRRTADIPLAGLHLWLRADVGVVAPAQPGLASQWIDQSGQGRNASMATTARQPTLIGGALNGLPVVRFSDAQSMNLDVVAQPTAFTVFVVGKNSRPDEHFSMILGPAGAHPVTSCDGRADPPCKLLLTRMLRAGLFRSGILVPIMRCQLATMARRC